MKKTLLPLAGFLLTLLCFNSVADAELYTYDVFDADWKTSSDTYVRILNEFDDNRWYSNVNVDSCDINGGSITISSPVVYDVELYDAPIYRLFLSPYRINQLKEWDPSIDLSEVIMKEAIRDVNTDSVEFSFSVADTYLNTDQPYYAFIVPVSEYDEIWKPSHEICFQMNSNMCMWAEACDALELVVNPKEDTNNNTPDYVEANNYEENNGTNEEYNEINTPIEEHGASCVGMNLANVSHTINNNIITLKWNAVDGDTVQIAVFDHDEEIYKSLGSARMSDEKFNYTMQWNGEHNFMLTNGCKEVYYKADAAIKTPDTTIVPPATWTAENVLYIAIAAIVLYGAYTIFLRKADNK